VAILSLKKLKKEGVFLPRGYFYRSSRKQIEEIQEEKMSLRDRLIEECRRYRMENGITQRELGEKLGKHTSAVGRFEIGAIDPRLKFVECLLDAMGKEIVIVDKVNR
jgi:ribosome-binding protein aMBF1 (putative translation factor)